MPSVFVSYRREDSRHQAGRLYDRLVARFGSGQVFKDVDSIPFGRDFRQVLTERVAACDVFLAIIGDEWLSVTGKSGTRRLDDPSDFVRIEIEAALNRDIPVIPVLVGNAPVPPAEELPECLRALSFRNGLAVRPDPDFHNDLDRLIRGIEEGVSARLDRSTPRGLKTEGPEALGSADSTASTAPQPSPAAAVKKAADTAHPLPAQFGRYRIIERLSQGGIAPVYLAEDTRLNRRVALKVSDFGLACSPEARKRFLEGARAAALLDHPFLCRVLDVGEIDGRLYLARVYIEGKSLAESTRGRSLPPRQAAALVGKLALAMQQAHKKKVIHRGLKPANIMLTTTGERCEPVIVDFGQFPGENPQDTRFMPGKATETLSYTAPEQIRGDLKDIGPACDIYALGVILYELLTGRLPFSGSGLEVASQILTITPLPPSTYQGDLVPALEAICLKAMAKYVGDRYTSMGELAADLTNYLHSPSSAPTQSSSAGSPGSTAKIAARPPRVTQSSSEGEPHPLPAPEPCASRAPSPGRRRLKQTLVVAPALLGVVLFGVIIYVATDEGRIKIVVNDPKAIVKIDKKEVRIEELGAPITLRAGEHALEVTWGDGEFQTRRFVVRRGDDERLRVEYEPTPNGKADTAAAGAPPPSPSMAGRSTSGSPTTQPQSATTKPPRNQLENLLVKGSVWRGSFRSANSESMSQWELWVQERAGPTFRGVQIVRPGIHKLPQSAVPVQGAVRANDLRYWPAAPDAQTFVVVGAWNGSILEMESDAREGAVTKARLQRDPDKPESARLVFSIYDERGNDGWYTSSQDDSGPGPQPISIQHLTGKHFYWLHTNTLTNGKRWEWHAPAKYHGDHSAKFGRCLVYGLITAEVGSDAQTYQFVRLRSADMTLHLHGSGRQADGSMLEPVKGGWKAYCVRLDASAGWKKSGTEEHASDKEIKAVLDGLTDFCITGGESGVNAGFGCLGSIQFGADDPFSDNSSEAAEKPGAGADSTNLPKQTINSIGMKLALIPAGEFMMGSPPNDRDAADDERPQHLVRISKAFYLGAHEVTRGQFRRFVEATRHRTDAEHESKGGWGWDEQRWGQFWPDPKFKWRTPGFPQTDEHPVVIVTWNDAVTFCEWLSRTEGKTYRLPTEAEWEYACRAGTTTRYSSGDDPESLATVGNVGDGTLREKYPAWSRPIISARDGFLCTAPVGQFRPNAFGLFDMHGNVWEFCQDGYDAGYYTRSPRVDPLCPSQSSARVMRGGGWVDPPRFFRSAEREGHAPSFQMGHIGFRVALDPAPLK
jgi:formylglycine-generating enzyme required for sulfatase activity/serine/threonine protein kinase